MEEGSGSAGGAEMPAAVGLQSALGEWLADCAPREVAGGWGFERGRAMVFVTLADGGSEGIPGLNVLAPVAMYVEASEDLFQYVATSASRYDFCVLALERSVVPDRYLLSLVRAIAPDEARQETVVRIARQVAELADALCQPLQDRFRGVDIRTLPDAQMPESGTQPFQLPESLWPFAAVVPPAPAPTVPREATVMRLLALLSTRDAQTPLVVADDGHGRTALARCLATAVSDPSSAGSLAGWPVVRLNPEAFALSDAQTLAFLFSACQDRAIVFLDDVEVLTGLAGYFRPDVVAQIRGALKNPRLRLVLTMSTRYVDTLELANSELLNTLCRIELPEMSDAEVLAVARAEAAALAAHHGVEIDDEVIVAAVAPRRQIDTKNHPGLAVERLDRAAAAGKGTRVAAVDGLATAIAGQAYVSFDASAVAADLAGRVLGQDHSIQALVDRLAVTRASLDARSERPDGVFLLAGPTGTGKTELAIALAHVVYGTPDALIRVDMSEYADEWCQSKLFGSAPGLVGSDRPESWLTTRVRQKPQSVLLLDEIEKAHPVIWNSFLQVFDAGRMTDSMGRTADFRDVIVFMTTNIGAEAFAERSVTGFVSPGDAQGSDERRVREEIKLHMAPELINRLDEILVFGPLSPETVRRIVEKQLAEAIERLGRRGWHVQVGSGVVDVLCTRGYSREYGARPLLRELERSLLGPIGALPLGPVSVSVSDGSLVVTTGSRA